MNSLWIRPPRLSDVAALPGKIQKSRLTAVLFKLVDFWASIQRIPVPVLTPSVVTSRPTTASRPSTPLNPSPLAAQIRLCWPLCAFINNISLLTYMWVPVAARGRVALTLQTAILRLLYLLPASWIALCAHPRGHFELARSTVCLSFRLFVQYCTHHNIRHF